jgi:hypothetical protein
MPRGRMICKKEIHGAALRDMIRDYLIENHPSLRAYASTGKNIWIEVEDRQPVTDARKGFNDWNLLVEVFESAEEPCI